VERRQRKSEGRRAVREREWVLCFCKVVAEGSHKYQYYFVSNFLIKKISIFI